jgi:hypothetical protein
LSHTIIDSLDKEYYVEIEKPWQYYEKHQYLLARIEEVARRIHRVGGYPMEPVIALIYDCDDTLCRDTTDSLLERHGVNLKEFWSSVNRQVEKGWDPPLAYLTRVLELIVVGTP